MASRGEAVYDTERAERRRKDGFVGGTGRMADSPGPGTNRGGWSVGQRSTEVVDKFRVS